jgi:probable F420-dependent oxidoreductase
MKVKIGFGLGTTAASAIDGETFWTIVDTCESLGWDSLWFSERASGATFGPLAAMAAVAGRTRRLKFGPSVLVVPGRNPVLLAKELATIDVLSNGRLVTAFGLGVEDPRERAVFAVEKSEAAARTEEAVALMRRLWTENEVSHDGRFFHVRAVRLQPRPAQKPHPDIWFGGFSRAALRRTAELGTGWLPSFVAPEEYREKADAIRNLASSAGRVIDEEHYGALVPYVSERARKDAEPILAAIGVRRPDRDPSRLVVFESDGQMRARLEEFIAAGASKFVLVPIVPPPDWREELARLFETVVRPTEGTR